MITQNLPAITANNGESKTPIAVGSRGIMISNLTDLWRFSQYVATSGLAPRGMERPETVLVAIQLGLELGLSPMAALQNIGVINGRPGVYGDAALALVLDSGLLDDFDEWFEIGYKRATRLPDNLPDDCAACCLSKRRGRANPVLTTFSVADAKRADLWGKALYKSYPQRMLKFRARGFNLRDNFPDVLKGFKTYEEVRDMRGSEDEPTPEQTAQRKTDDLVRGLPPGNGAGKAAAPPEPPPQASAEPPRTTTPAKAGRARLSNIEAHVRQGIVTQDGLADIMASIAPGVTDRRQLTAEQADSILERLAEVRRQSQTREPGADDPDDGVG